MKCSPLSRRKKCLKLSSEILMLSRDLTYDLMLTCPEFDVN